ncbi:glycerophosphodiester phosphodiesterase family protein [Lactobacillus sp.]|uniref:glycerophosphodiester phosphodiesterase family protein n=1 Tax=Lactobacillus sp. TaxID=1591 RepID=UPI003EF9D05F
MFAVFLVAGPAKPVSAKAYFPKKLKLKAGQKKKLSISSKKKIRWSSSKKSVATVYKSGWLLAKKAGHATITAKAGKKKWRNKITVTAVKKKAKKAKKSNKSAKKTTKKPVKKTVKKPKAKKVKQMTTLTILPNGGEGQETKLTYQAGKAVKLPELTFTKKDCVFTGFNTEADGLGESYEPGKSYKLTAKVLYAQYRAKEKYTVHISANGGFGQDQDLTAFEGDEVTLPTSGYAKPGYTLAGFNSQKNGQGKEYALGAKVKLTSQTLYAKYEAKKISEPLKQLEQWGIDDQGNYYENSQTAATVSFVTANQPLYFTASDFYGYQIQAVKYSQDQGDHFISKTAWLSQGVILDSGYKYRFLIKKANGSAMSASDLAAADQVLKAEAVNEKAKTVGSTAPAAQLHVIAHRGYSAKYPENSTLAFDQAAANSQVWGIETDVANTSDGKLICLHDATLNRTTDIAATDPNYGKSVNQLTFDQVESYHLKGVLASDQGKVYEDLHVPTLTQYLESCKKGGKEAFLELKNINNLESLKKVLAEIKAAGMEDKTTLISFKINQLEMARQLPDGQKMTMMGIYGRELDSSDWLFLSHLKLGADVDFNHLSAVDLLAADQYGVKVGVWTVNEKGQALDDLIKAGISDVTTNRVDLLTDDK